MSHHLSAKFTVAMPVLLGLLIAPVRTVAQSQDPEVRAFIPMLNPARRVEPAYPESARVQSLQGMVEVLITFNPAGRVTKTETLTGAAGLREAAMDAVKQWTFRPVFRDGQAVYSMTTAMVDVIPPRLPGAPYVPLNIDLAETIAATKRTQALAEKMPRSPRQVQIDLEQQSAGAGGLRRFYQLPALAKAALKAGEFDTAKAYAGELLQMALKYTRDWNYGNAIYDGNMVLGLVALHEGSVSRASQFLLDAGKTPGSPQLNSFGPNMTLAKELIDANERDSVLRYFDLCRAFWKMGTGSLDSWSATVRGGGKPFFGANLVY